MDEARVNQILSAQSKLPIFLRRSRTQIETDEETQTIRKASFGRGRLTEEERTVSRGTSLEQIARANLELPDVDERVERIRLAEGLELQGHFLDAAEAHPDDDEKERLRNIESAIQKDDDHFCKCQPTTHEVSGKAVEIHPHYEVKKVYSRRHKTLVSLVGCRDCPALNATPVPPQQLQRVLHAHRTAAIAGKPTEHEHAILK